MTLVLVYEDLWSVDLHVDEGLVNALDANRARAIDQDAYQAFELRLQVCISRAIGGFLELDFQLPSTRQIRYATDIARELGIDIPAEALRYKEACKEFIERFVEAFKSKREGRMGRDPIRRS
jgi:hypothetical protein